MSPVAKPSPSKSIWHHLPNWDMIFKFGTMEMLSSLLPLSLERQNIPDGFIIPCYPQNIQFPAPKPTQPPAYHFWHCLYLFTGAPNPPPNSPTLLHTPALPSGTLGIPTTLPAHPKDEISNPTPPQHPSKHPVLLVFLAGWQLPLYMYQLVW